VSVSGSNRTTPLACCWIWTLSPDHCALTGQAIGTVAVPRLIVGLSVAFDPTGRDAGVVSWTASTLGRVSALSQPRRSAGDDGLGLTTPFAGLMPSIVQSRNPPSATLPADVLPELPLNAIETPWAEEAGSSTCPLTTATDLADSARKRPSRSSSCGASIRAVSWLALSDSGSSIGAWGASRTSVTLGPAAARSCSSSWTSCTRPPSLPRRLSEDELRVSSRVEPMRLDVWVAPKTAFKFSMGPRR